MNTHIEQIKEHLRSCKNGKVRWSLFKAICLLRVSGLCIPAVEKPLTTQLSRDYARRLTSPLLRLSSREIASISGAIPALAPHIPHLTPYDLGRLYESILHPARSDKDGIVYTPTDLAKRMVHEALATLAPAEGTNVAVLDPSCGGGVFLLAALDELATREPTRSLADLAESSLYGVDRDRHAAEVARFALKIAMLDRGVRIEDLPDLTDQIIHGDALLEPNHLTAHPTLRPLIHPQCLSERFSKVFERGGFDLIVGNPPYGLSRDSKIHRIENEILQKVYRDIRTGKVNKYMLFMGRGFNLLREGGVVSLVVPNSWLGIRSGIGIRQKILTEGYLSHITVLPSDTFDTASVEVVSFIATRGVPQSDITILNASTGTQSVLPYTVPLSHPQKIIPTVSSAAAALLEQLATTCFPLGSTESPFRPSIALQAYAVGKGIPPQSKEDVKNHIFDRTFKEDSSTYPYLHGRDVGRFKTSWSGDFLKYGPWLAEPMPLTRFSGPRLLVREILGKAPYAIQAAFVSDTALYNKSVLHIHLKTQESEDALWALLALLNSPLASLIISLNGRKSQRTLFPKLVNDDLKSFPIPRCWQAHVGELATVAKTITARGPSPDLERELRDRVRAVYGIDEGYEFSFGGNSVREEYAKVV